MTSFSDIREALASNLSAILGMQVSAYMLANPTPPCAHIVPDPAMTVEYDSAMGRGSDTWHLKVQAMVANTLDIGAQKKLDALLDSAGPTSVKEALEADRTLGGVAYDLHVQSAAANQQYVFDGRPPLLGAEWLIEVIASG